MKRMKKSICLLLAAGLLLALLPVFSSAAVVASGNCGDNSSTVTWTLTDDGLLTISGSGWMANYGESGHPSKTTAPWGEYSSDIKKVVINSGVTQIGSSAFALCRAITEVSIPEGVTSIEYGAFRYCQGLKYVTLPDSLITIARSAFEFASLENITIPDNVTTIDHDSFYSCELKSVHIGRSATTIGYSAFSGNNMLNTLTVDPGNEKYYSTGNCVIEKGTTNLVIGCPGSVIPADGSVTAVNSNAFYYSRIKDITIPDCVTSIGFEAFCSSRLEQITIGSGVTSIASKAFYDCRDLTDVYYYGTQEDWDAIEINETGNDDLNNATLHFNTIVASGRCGSNLVWTLNEWGRLTIGGGGTVEAYAFAERDDITEVVTVGNVTGIDEGAFSYCENLRSVNLSEKVASIGNYAFDGCEKLAWIGVPAGVTYVGEFAFEQTDWWNTQADGLIYLGKTAYRYKGDMPANTELTLRDGTAYITTEAFEGQGGLTAITIPNSVTQIGTFVFSGTGLTSVALPSLLTVIPSGTFYGCAALNTVTIPARIKTIQDRAFEGCTGLQRVYYFGTLRVRRFMEIDEDGNAALMNATSYVPPLPPQNVTAKATGAKKITVSYALSNNATQYNIYRCDSGTENYAYKGTSYNASWNDTSVSAGVAYDYKVVAVYKDAVAALVSDRSEAASATAVGNPAAPTGVTAKATGDKKITVSYNAVNGATQYNIYRYNSEKQDYVYKGTSYTTAWDDTSVSAGTTYYYKVVAVIKTADYTLTSAMSASANAKAVGTPAAPTGVTAKATGDKTITVSYNAVSGATQYNIYRYNGSTKTYVYKGTSYTTSWDDTTVSAGTTYYYKVVAVIKTADYTLVSALSAEASAKAIGAPAAPTGVTAKATGDKTITVSYNAVSGATQYNIYRYNGSTKTYVYKGTSYTTSWDDTTVSAGTTYYYKVVAVIKTADYTLVSAQSAAANAKAVGTPAAPTGVTAKATGDKKITVSYNAVTGATQYNIYRYNGSTKTYVYKGTSYTTSWNDTTVSVGTTYYYKVVSVIKTADYTLVSAQSAAANAKAVGTPAVPQNVQATAAAGKITVSWSASTGATQYNIYRYNGAKKEYLYKGTSYTTSWDDTTVSAGTTYYYKVVAVTKGSGLTFVSEKSAAVNAKAK